MFYEYKCIGCRAEVLINKPIEQANIIEVCPECREFLKRVYSSPTIHMNRMIAEGIRRTNEPPDELKPDTYHWDNEKNITSYPGKAAKRGRKGMKN